MEAFADGLALTLTLDLILIASLILWRRGARFNDVPSCLCAVFKRIKAAFRRKAK